MYIALVCALFFCFCVVCSGKYVVPPSLVEPLKPKGLRVSIPDEEGITLMAFHGNINIPFEGLEAGEMAKDIIRKRGNRWVFEDKNIKLKKGDVIYYWIYVILDGLGYQGLDRNHTVIDFVGETMNRNPPCQQSATTVRGVSECAQKLLFEASFKGDTIDTNTWFQERKIGGSQMDDEFVVFDADSSHIAGDKLEIKPSLTEEKYNEAFVKTGVLNVQGCTSSEEQFCTKHAGTYLIMPPVLTSRLSTKNSFTFKYGTVEIKAKLPQGDWIVPELWLEPKDPGNTGRIVISLTRGNSVLTADGGNDISTKTVAAGVVFGPERERMLRKVFSTPMTQDYHTFKLIWTQNILTFLVDNNEVGKIDSPEPGQDFIPFNTEYYITLGVHVGGLRDFPDLTLQGNNKPKPWNNGEPKRVLKFWQDRNNWFKTWNRDSSLLVEHVKVWAL